MIRDGLARLAGISHPEQGKGRLKAAVRPPVAHHQAIRQVQVRN
jgi:hypothetical protein